MARIVQNRSPHQKNPKAQKIAELASFLENLLSSDSYIAKSDYLKKLDDCKDTLSYFQDLQKDDLLNNFCEKNSIPIYSVLSVIQKSADIKNLVSAHNENFIAQKLVDDKSYLDAILREIDPHIMLDDDQRRVVLTDEDYCLVIAGAGAGKTTTVAAKEKINKQLKIACPITTFHSTGNAILHKDGEEKLNIVQNEILRSQEEVQIANFLYLNNIEYEYEPRYKFNIEGAKKPYTPDFIIRQNGKEAYIEHFGITQSGKSDRYTAEELKKYLKAGRDKLELHKRHGTTLLCTFSEFNDGKPMLEHLRKQLEKKGFVLNPRDNKESKAVGEQIKFKYIIVDEYQDISRQRFDLVGALHDVTNAKIIAVGDDWQSIYAFSGSDITLFTKFSEIMGYAELLKITKTYRNSQEVIDIAGNFIQKNTAQIRKTDVISWAVRITPVTARDAEKSSGMKTITA